MSNRRDEQLNHIVARLEQVRPTRHGWMARCPAHVDRSPSLTVREGERGVLLKCFAGCTINEICGAIGIEVKDLFFDRPVTRRSKSAVEGKQSRRPDWRATATALKQHALGLFLRSESVLEAAQSLAISSWSEEDLDQAVRAVSGAYADAEHAALLEDVAYSLRAKGLNAERQHYESRRRTTQEPR